MIYAIETHYFDESLLPNAKELAEQKLIELRQQRLIEAADRFSVVKEIPNGDSITWVVANLDNDLEECNYQVFNTLTGRHELLTSFSAAKIRVEEIKQEFLRHCSLDQIKEFETMPDEFIAADTKKMSLTVLGE